MFGPDFDEIISGWMLIDDFYDLTDRIERVADLQRKGYKLNEHEQKTIEFMIRCQIARVLENKMPRIICYTTDSEEFYGNYNTIIANIRSVLGFTVQEAHDYLMERTEKNPFIYRDGTRIWVED